MWTTRALVVAVGLTLGGAEPLTISNVRPTYGLLGAERSDNQILPGDLYFLAFDIDGFKVADDGKVSYTMAMEITDSQGKVIHGKDPRNLEVYNALGSGRLQAFVIAEAGLNQPPGEYTVNVSVTDRTTKATQTLTRKFEILKKAFGLVRLTTSYDPDAHIAAAPGGVAGQLLYISFAAVGFERDSKRKQPDVVVELRVLDTDGKPTVAKPAVRGYDQDVTEEVVALPMSFFLPLNRPGKFTVELHATDKVAKKTAVVKFPLVVMEQKAGGTQK